MSERVILAWKRSCETSEPMCMPACYFATTPWAPNNTRRAYTYYSIYLLKTKRFKGDISRTAREGKRSSLDVVARILPRWGSRLERTTTPRVFYDASMYVRFPHTRASAPLHMDAAPKKSFSTIIRHEHAHAEGRVHDRAVRLRVCWCKWPLRAVVGLV